MFLFSFLLLIFCSFLKIKNHNRRHLFVLLYILLSLMVVFQDTIGADFYGYKALYYSIPKNFERMSLAQFVESNRDPMFSFIVIFFDKIGVSYIGFRMLVSALMMLFFFQFMRKYCTYSILSLFVFYALYYIYWVYSCFRQGFCMSYFLCVLFPLAIDKKYTKFYLLSIPMWGIHISSIVYLLAPFVISYDLTRKKIIYIFALSVIVYFLSSGFSSIFIIFDRMAGYMELDSSDNKYFAFAFRILIILPMLFVDPNKFNNRLFKISCNAFLFSFFLYCVFSFSELISARLCLYYRVFELVFISFVSLVYFRRKFYFIVPYYLLLYIFLYVKFILFCINTQMYPSDVNFFNFPYLSIFSEESVKSYYRGYFELTADFMYYIDYF